MSADSTTDAAATVVAEKFREVHGTAPEGVWLAPGRANLIGEHTDYNDGFVLPFALDRATFAAVRLRDDDVLTVASTGPFPVTQSTVSEVGPGTVEGWAAYPLGVLWALREGGHDIRGIDVVVHSTVPSGAGLSSSAALSCSVALAARDLLGLDLAPEELAGFARRAENEVAGAPTGPMDQLASVCGKADHVVFIDCRSLEVTPVPLGLESAGLRLVAIDTKAEHALVDGAYASRRQACEEAARILGVPALRDATPEDVEAAAGRLGPEVLRRARHVVTEDDRVEEVAALLRAGRVRDIGPVLDASHTSMRDDFEISSPELDAAVEAARRAGALGARMTGGGFGGSAIALVPDDRVDAVADHARRAFAEAGFPPPDVFVVTPSDGAHRVA